jgi:hypothetical protein
VHLQLYSLRARVGITTFHCGALYRIQAYTLGSKQVRRFSGSRTCPSNVEGLDAVLFIIFITLILASLKGIGFQEDTVDLRGNMYKISSEIKIFRFVVTRNQLLFFYYEITPLHADLRVLRGP